MRHDSEIVPVRLGNFERCKYTVANPKRRASCHKGRSAFSSEIRLKLITYFQSMRVLMFDSVILQRKHWNGFPAPTSTGVEGTRTEPLAHCEALDR